MRLVILLAGLILQRAAAGPILTVGSETSTSTHVLELRGVRLTKGIACSNASVRLTSVRVEPEFSEVLPLVSSDGCDVALRLTELANSRADGLREVGTGSLDLEESQVANSSGTGITSNGSVTLRRSMVVGNVGIGIVNAGGQLTVTRSRVSGNHGGGIQALNGSYDITNNFIFRNGSEDPPASGFGGLHLVSTAGTNRLQHNTIVRNDVGPSADPILAGGVFCSQGNAPNNIIVNNFRGNTDLANAQTGGSCDFTSSIIGNSDSVAGFVDAVGDDHHLSSASPAIGAGVSSTVVEDFDGDSRTGSTPDVGADEYVP